MKIGSDLRIQEIKDAYIRGLIETHELERVIQEQLEGQEPIWVGRICLEARMIRLEHTGFSNLV